MVSVVRDDAAAAKETMKAVRAHPGWLPLPGVGEEACAVTMVGKTEYVFVRQGARVLGVGDEDFVAGKGQPLSRDEKIALVKKWLAASPTSQSPLP